MNKIEKWILFYIAWVLILCGSALATHFSDVPENAWYTEGVRFVSENALMNGTASNTFSPDQPLNRAQFVVIMYRMKGAPPVSAAEFQKLTSFHDIPENAWYLDAAAWAFKQGVINGYGDGTFRAGNALSRGQLFALLYRLAGSPHVAGIDQRAFADEAQTPLSFRNAVAWAREKEIAIGSTLISGEAENRLQPNTAAYRAYVAVVLQRFLTAYPSQMTKKSAERSEKAYAPYLLSDAVYPECPQQPSEIEDDISAGLDLFFSSVTGQFLSDAKGKNRVCSPLNIYLALGMLAGTCGGESRQQILTLLGAKDVNEVYERAAALWKANYYDSDQAASLLANSLWMNQSFADSHGSLNDSTVDTIAEHFYASLFSGQAGTEEYNDALHAWLNEHTGEMLKEQASNLELSPSTVLALISTISFHAEWKNEFQESRTKSDIFHSKTADIACDFMNRSGRAYYVGENFSAVGEPLKNGGAMWFVLPNRDLAAEDLLRDKEVMRFLSTGKSPWKYQSKADMLTVYESIPKFDVTSEIDLIEGLKELGVVNIFDGDMSDFTPLWKPVSEQDREIKLALTQAEHDARVSIDEKGCRAEAFTYIALGASARPGRIEEIYFTVDRPFLFAITDANDILLFTGIVNCPVEN